MTLTLKKITLFIVSITMFMDVMDSNVLNTAVPVIAQSFQVSPVDLKIALIGYLLSFAIFIPTSGWVSDRYGTRRIFIIALTIFTVTSFFCGFSKTLHEIVIARIIQGIGGAFMISLSRLMIARVFPRNELVDAMNAVITFVSMGVMLGPFVGGFIVDHWPWSWIFWVNIPVGVILITLSAIFLKETTQKIKMPFDFLGFLLFGGGLALFCFSISSISDSNTPIQVPAILLISAILVLICYVPYAWKRKNPLIQLPLLKIRTFRISVTGNIFARLGFGGIPFLLPLMQQICLGFSAQLSGLLLIPIAIGSIVAKMLAIKVLRSAGYRSYLLINTVIVAGVLAAFQLINLHSSIFFIAFMTFMFGLLISTQYTAMNSLAFADITDEKLSASTSITSTVQIFGQTLGVAMGAILLRIFSHDLSLNIAVFHKTFLGLSIITLLSTLIFLQLTPEDGLTMLVKKKSHEK